MMPTDHERLMINRHDVGRVDRTRARHTGTEPGEPLRPRSQLRRVGGGGNRDRAAATSVLASPFPNHLRWTVGERLRHVFEQACDRFADRVAIDTGDLRLTYSDLDRRANQVARHLIDCGIGAGDRVALLFDKGVEMYVALLAVLKLDAAYVPFDPGFPPERIRFILGDAGVKAIVSMSAFAGRLAEFDIDSVMLDAEASAIDDKQDHRLTADEIGSTTSQLCYVIYTSGTTGNPKGVAIEHPSICNFVRAAAETYGYQPPDRVYQGMSIAFDFSIEELWVPLVAGATLVPSPPGGTLLGDELADFLERRSVTCMACCPTLLATIERDLPKLRLLLVGGEACPQNLVTRWYRPGRTILNTYGPTEGTVTCTVTELVPDKPVTIGVPMPTYSIVILDPANDRLAEPGELGEIGIAGIGVAAGYLNRDELTAKKFIRDFVGIDHNPSGRIYRTGDLGRIDHNGEIDYRGRIDTQVKIRGYRIELAEIEAVLLDMPEIGQAAVTTYSPEPGTVELVAYYAPKSGLTAPARADIVKALKARLPAYMVPAYLEELDVIPMTLSNKADHKRLPNPTTPFVALAGDMVDAKTDSERVLVAALCEVLKLERVSTTQHFFDDLGANSLVMARFCAKIRQIPGMSNASMRDIYLNPTIARLADHFDHAAIDGFVAQASEPFHVPSDFSYWSCGALQLLFFAVYGLFGVWVFDVGLEWTYAAANDPLALYLRSVGFAAGSFAVFTAVPIVAKWLLVGRFKAQSFPIWSLRYVRFWTVKMVTRTAPAVMFAGTPIYNVYLRLLGAKIGRGAVVTCRFVPVATDLITIGDGAILRKDSILLGYRAQSNFIHTGPVEIGKNAFVGEASVLDIDTAMGDDSQLGHGSSLQSGQCVPDGKHFHGSPAVETSADYCPIEKGATATLRRAVYSALQIAGTVLIAVPLPIFLLSLWEHHSATIAGDGAAAFDASLGTMAWVSAAWFLATLLAGLATVYAVPRLCQMFLKPGRTYPLFGFHYWLQSVVEVISNPRELIVLFGDSSAIVHYMRFLGWNLNRVEQTGSNFGTNQKHDNPFLCDIGSGTMVSDGLSMINKHKSAAAFRLEETRIGDHNYLGNNIHYPPGGRTGANVLLGTKTMIPVDGKVHENVGLLGSPAFEIPRMVERDRELLNGGLDETTRLARIGRKNRHNAVTAALFLLGRWAFFFATVAVWQIAFLNYASYGVFALFGATAAMSVAGVVLFVLIERLSLGFSRLVPKLVTIYDPEFWAHERHWKLSDSPIMQLFAGTPFKNLILWAVGVKIGRKVFDANCSITERTLTEIGDYANLNEGSVLQAHSLEEGVFKSDFVKVGKGSTLGPAAFVHYGVVMGEHVVVDADSFVMKGETLEAHTGWRGNPAKMVRGGAPAALPAVTTDEARPFVPRLAAE
jgi:non-ribosomal peptide synthetase-like protein